MAKIKLDLFGPPTDGQDIKFRAPCDCTQIDGLLVAFPDGEQEYTFRDAHGHNLAGIGNLFAEGAYVKAILDTGRRYAYLQNADTNSFLHSAVFGTYTHEGENLAGHGENGKFKATTSGTISAINVNGVSCSVKCGDANSMDLIAGCWYTFILDGDTVNFNAGGAGGGGLNFKVVGGIEEPASPSENTIWIATETPVNGYAFSATEPAEPVEGLVWFLVKISSTVEFNALKKGALMVYPVSAKQYNAGVWEDIVARSYQAGEWVEWIAYLYNEGDQCVDATGGWTAENNSRARWSIEETHIAAGYIDGSEGLAGSAHTSERIIFDSSKKMLSAEVEVDSPYSASIGGIFGLRDVANASAYPENAFVACKSFLTSGLVELDISGITAGSYYVTFGGIWNGRVKKVWWA